MHGSLGKAALLGALLAVGPPAFAATGATVEYRNAQVWDGQRMVRRTLVIRDGRFVAQSRRADRTIVDLAGRFIVPAFGNAHEHVTNSTIRSSWDYLEEGVFYVWNPNSIIIDDEDRRFFARPDTVDVAFSNGGITEPGGHPETLYVDLLSKYVYKGKTKEYFVGNAYHYGATKPQIDRAIELLAAQKSDFVKAYLLFGEEYDRRRADPTFDGARGLNPANVPYLVETARRRGLETIFHVETSADLLTAVRAGASAAGHLPAYRSGIEPEWLDRMRLSKAQAREIARSRMRLIPTYGLAKFGFETEAQAAGYDPSARDRTFAVQAANLRLLTAAGAIFLTGTDRNPAIFDEIEHWVAIGGMSDAEALQAALATGRRMFPKRRIGCFEPGCEADFVVLANDPTRDLRGLRSIVQLVKAGVTLAAPPKAE